MRSGSTTMVTMDVDRENVPHVSSAATTATTAAMDEVQYSRLMYTIGRDAVMSLHRSRVLIIGCKGLGAEIAKNLILSGVAGIGLVDEDVVSISDLGTNFCLQEPDIGRNRAVATSGGLRKLNPSADVDVLTEPSIEASLSQFNLVLATTGTLQDLIRLNWLCRKVQVPFIASQTRGLFSYVFADLGDCYTFKDDSGEPTSMLLIANITQDNPATVTVVEEQRHGLEDGDEVIFTGIKGMSELNESGNYRVTVTGSHTFTIPVDTRGFGRYISNGYFQKVIPIKSVNYVPLEISLQKPAFMPTGNLELSRDSHLHLTLQAIDEFERSYKEANFVPGRLSFGENDIDKIVAKVKEAWQTPVECIAGMKPQSSNSETSDIQAEKNGSSDQASMSTRPGIGCRNDVSEAEAKKNMCAKASANLGPLDEQLVKTLAQAANVDLCPLVAITGGIAAQEVIKVLGNRFRPLHQWIYYDVIDCAPIQPIDAVQTAPIQSRHDLQTALFGREFQQKLGGLQLLVIGAGGIGCEVLKNLVLMGVGCSSSGCITVTDMDQISKPNFTDQLLYHIDDLGKPKSAAAGRALRKINPDAQIRALQEKFDVETESVFDSSFFKSLSGVFSAVDSSSSRLYIDMRCVAFRRPMVDGGKHGGKGSVQVFLPFQSEMYASSRDPPEFKETLICTLRNFPYSTDHTIRWAVEMFESLFKQRPEDVNSYLSNREFQESVKKGNPATRLPVLETLCDSLSRYKPLSFAACIKWARLQFEELFCNNIKQLRFNFPEDMVTSSGAPFWSGTKRAPVPLIFDAMEHLHFNFIVAAANLQATVYGLKGCQDRALFLDVLQSTEVPPFEPKEGIKIALSDNDLRGGGQHKTNLSSEDSDAAEKCDALMRELPTPASLAGYRLTPIEFDKDDERNFHAEFVAACANLRAMNYGIPLSDTLQARLVGGRAIPSIVTTTSVVGGMMCLELYKLVLEKPLHCYKHSYFNLALPLISSAQPIKAVVNKVERSDRSPLSWTLWDKFEMNCIGMTLEKFLKEFKEQYGLEITMLSYGKSLLYAEFVPKKKLNERMPLTLLDLISSVAKVTIPATESRLIFSLSCSDASDNDVDVPDIIVEIR